MSDEMNDDDLAIVTEMMGRRVVKHALEWHAGDESDGVSTDMVGAGLALANKVFRKDASPNFPELPSDTLAAISDPEHATRTKQLLGPCLFVRDVSDTSTQILEPIDGLVHPSLEARSATCDFLSQLSVAGCLSDQSQRAFAESEAVIRSPDSEVWYRPAVTLLV